jgi:predicted metal-dependent phosphoesterase TrpH
MRVPLFDLHCHTTYSDGSLSVTELIALAKQKGLSGLAITDHDTFAAFYETKLGDNELRIIPGIEISAKMGKESVHVLGYSFDPRTLPLLKLCELQAKRRMDRNLALLAKLAEHGMPISEEEIAISKNPWHSFGRVHIAQGLVKKGYVADIAQAFSRFIGDGKSCYVAADHPTVEEVLSIIHEAKGKAVLAHPHLIKRNSVVRALMNLEFDGIEAYYGNFGKERAQKWVRYADEKGWFVTGGSDFHGEAKPHAQLGLATTDPAVFEFLYNHFLSHTSLEVNYFD